MSITVDASELAAEAHRAARIAGEVGNDIPKHIRRGALIILRIVKQRMPVDTGAARNSWGVPSAGGIWDELDNGLTIVQGSKLPYIGRLNDGWSRQAPAGFIDASAQQGLDEITDDILNELMI